MTLTLVLQIQEQLWSSLSNPRAAMQELAGETLPVGHACSHQTPREPRKGWGWEYCGRDITCSFGL